MSDPNLLVHRVFQRPSGLKLWLPRGSNLNWCTSLGISSLTSGAIGDTEISKSNQLNIVTLAQGIGDGAENTINSFGGISLRCVNCGRYCCDKIVLVHDGSPWNFKVTTGEFYISKLTARTKKKAAKYLTMIVIRDNTERQAIEAQQRQAKKTSGQPTHSTGR